MSYRSKLNFFLMMVCLWAPSAWALPGQTTPQLEQWVAQHAFFTSKLEGPEIHELNGDGWYTLTQNLPQQVMPKPLRPQKPRLALRVLCPEPAKDNLPRICTDHYLILSEMPDFGLTPPRHYVPPTYPAIWQPSNPRAASLLLKIYGPHIAQDFLKAIPIYSGPEYVQADTEYYRDRVTPYPQSKTLPRVMLWSQEVKIYRGNTFAYEVSNILSPLKKGFLSLRVFPLQQGLTDAETLVHNQKQYQVYLKQAQ